MLEPRLIYNEYPIIRIKIPAKGMVIKVATAYEADGEAVIVFRCTSFAIGALAMKINYAVKSRFVEDVNRGLCKRRETG